MDKSGWLGGVGWGWDERREARREKRRRGEMRGGDARREESFQI